ncbi:MAG: arginase [Flavobacteriaceae bacterium CG_4_8_14_3_um_filter_34_10]|nr:formimidoylglutamase [Flavobacteriia bacterium]OIP51047.1 MAG: arginase [Flavobacteriaceae bacterium CG2_30_34_30]PIQ19071.1 MAG: arginase [Flavobacteriaceae bacterium CG18_big_fil_WC_8_21_14_2_50_34_36]PIV49303.1 MAG: arginase [Flavobacteriaceae bacterium CG02_land_8_20_14_3_00_34_13]PIX10619.1 MAG: arginase [Flavobacteriaceae bacterium CG_4_8_14_3_um_filter_34_10]PIZ07977.1 MAG: arginase [Flavobacteriaceae bacterium CG_4_10_14_0_8_um_filter_34_31]PJC06922.1 MAG: arginase [Flavobacteriace
MLEFFSPVSKTVMAQREVLPDGVLGKNLQIYSEKTGFPELEKCNLALFGIRESRRDINFIGNFPTFDAIRNSFYSLYAGNWHHSIADMGDIKAGATVEDTYFAVTSVVNHLVSRNIIPIILGGSQDLLYPIYRAYDSFGKMINFVNIDSKFDIGNADAPISNTSYVGKMVVDKPYNLFNYSTIGYQTYFNATEEIALLDKLFFDAYRLGEITNDISLVEPITRDADIVSMDVSAIKDGELSYLVNKSPNGFNSREICAISRYAGISNRVSVFGIFEISELAKNTSAAMLLAQVIWYFIEGVNYRIKDGNTSLETDFTTYKVPIDDEVLIFKKSLKTQRWWIELPFISNVNNKLKRHTLLPCTYQDYENACNQEIPERWYKARRKNEM